MKKVKIKASTAEIEGIQANEDTVNKNNIRLDYFILISAILSAISSLITLYVAAQVFNEKLEEEELNQLKKQKKEKRS